MAKMYDFLFNILLIGDEIVGKSAVIVRYAQDAFKSDSKMTIGELSCFMCFHCTM